MPPPQETEWPKGALFTVGHSTLPIERFVALAARLRDHMPCGHPHGAAFAP